MTDQSLELSFEFFPPRTAASQKTLDRASADLVKFEPAFCSVTYGAGGTTQEGTFDAVKQFLALGVDAAPHLTCVGASKAQIQSTVQQYIDIGVKRFVILRGDLPSGMVERGQFKYAADLVRFIRDSFGYDVHLEVGAYPDFHPESTSPDKDIAFFKAKMEAGANSAITQYFFNADSYFAYLDEAVRAGVSAPIVPGIMPITNYATLVRFSDACGADIPRWIRARLEQYKDDEASLKAFGLDVVTHLCMDLLDNQVPGLHFYTLNRAETVSELCRRVGFQARC